MSKDEKQFSRRDFLKTTGAATGGIIGGSLLGGLVGYRIDDTTDTEAPETEEASDTEETVTPEQVTEPGRMFFENDADFDTISQAMERIFPEDDMGPGAISLGAPYFLDGQLAGDYGANTKEYMQGPFYEGSSTQGYQSRLNRRDYFTLGIERINVVSNDQFDSDFTELEDDQKDEILSMFQDGDADMDVPAHTATSGHFFSLLRTATLEGVYADPMYRGNRNMDGWRMKNFPGHQMAYINEINTGDFHEIEPQPLFGGNH